MIHEQQNHGCVSLDTPAVFYSIKGSVENVVDISVKATQVEMMAQGWAETCEVQSKKEIEKQCQKTFLGTQETLKAFCFSILET